MAIIQSMSAGDSGGGSLGNADDSESSGYGLMAQGAGAFIGLFGKLKSNSDKASAERQNAAYYREQAAYVRESTLRELSIFSDKSTRQTSNVVGAYASSGVALSGSALAVIADQNADMLKERAAIAREGAFKAALAEKRAQQADQVASDLTSPMTTGMTIASSALSFAGGL